MNRLASDRRGVAVVELALITPMLLVLLLYGAEVTNYAITRQRVSQLALQVADNGSRIGKQSDDKATPITEKQINDLFIGAQLQSANLDIGQNGRIVLTQLETNKQGGQTIRWQRCYGKLAHATTYKEGDGATGKPSSVPGLGPAAYRVTATSSIPVIYVEIAYTYKPVIPAGWAPGTSGDGKMVEIAAMQVRDDRDTSGPGDGVYNDELVPQSLCK